MATVNPGGPNTRPFTVRSPTRPANPASGGHYVNLGGNVWQQIHAVGPGKWAPGPPSKQSAAPAANARAATAPKAANPYANPIFDPSQQLSGKPLFQAVQGLTNATYNPVINQYKQQISQRTAQGAAAQKATAGYFNQLGQYAQQASDRANSIGSNLNTTLANIGQGTQSALSQYAQQAATPALQSLANQGLDGGATQQLAGQLAQLRSTAGQEQQSRQDYGASVGSAASQLAAQNLGAYALGGQQQLGKIGQATQLALTPMETNLTNEQAKKAAAFGTNLMAARAAERNWAATQEGLGLKQQTLQNAATQDALNRQAANQRNAATIAGANKRNQASINAANTRNQANINSREKLAAQKAAQKAASGTGAGKPLTLSENTSYWGTVAKGIYAVGANRAKGMSFSDIYSNLLQRLNPLQAQAAIELWTYHYLNPKTAAQLHNAGVRGGSYLGKPIQVGAPKTGPFANTLGGLGQGIAQGVSRLKFGG